MKWRNKKLMGEMIQSEVTRADIAEAIHRSTNYVGEVIRGAATPELYECYEIMRLIGKEAKDVADYFPPERLPDKYSERTQSL